VLSPASSAAEPGRIGRRQPVPARLTVQALRRCPHHFAGGGTIGRHSRRDMRGVDLAAGDLGLAVDEHPRGR
jgi:hypothetical protein